MVQQSLLHRALWKNLLQLLRNAESVQQVLARLASPATGILALILVFRWRVLVESLTLPSSVLDFSLDKWA